MTHRDADHIGTSGSTPAGTGPADRVVPEEHPGTEEVGNFATHDVQTPHVERPLGVGSFDEHDEQSPHAEREEVTGDFSRHDVQSRGETSEEAVPRYDRHDQ